jgi:HlyD family secretion protein
MNSAKPTLDDLRIERKPEARKNSALWVLVLIIVLLLVAAAVWWFRKPKPIPVRTVIAQEVAGSSKDRTVLNASGYVTARRAATVSSKVTGKVIEILIEEGMKVQEGQILARLDDTNVRASLRLAEAQLQSANAGLVETQARLKEAELNLRRTTSLASNSISAQSDLDKAEADAASYRARLEQQRAEIVVAERQVAAWQQQLDDTIIRAPFAGIVTSKNAQPGEMISPVSAGGGFTRTGICTIVDMQSLEIEIDVNESYINRVEAHQPVEATLDAYPDWKIPCKVIAIIPTADRQKSTVKVRVGFDQLDPRILPDMSVKVGFREAENSGHAVSRSITIPKTALRQENSRDIVFVVHDNRAERRAVTVAGAGPESVTIASGLSTNEKVIVEPPPNLADGMRVREESPVR